MALQSTCRNLYAAQQFIDATFVTIVIGASGRVAARSNPDTTATDGGGGAFTCTMPSGEGQILLGCESVNNGTNKPSVTALSSANGVTTFTLTDAGGGLTGTEEMHVTFLVIGA